AAGGVQLDAVGDLSPLQLSESGRREVRNLLRTRNLELTALHCPLDAGLDEPINLQPRIDYLRQVMTLAYDLGPRLVVAPVGQVPEATDEPRATLHRDALDALARHGDRVGTMLALDTGLESGETLAAYLASFDTGSLAANLSPGNLLLHGFDPRAATRALSGRIAQVQARDVRRASTSRAARETAVGAGDIDWLSYLELLEEIDYRGWLVVVRDEGERRIADVESGVRFLRRLLGAEA
ncbi:MAG: sugar phosphate isomerase/epimerase family protein, partial [Gemmataceae bacterium]